MNRKLQKFFRINEEKKISFFDITELEVTKTSFNLPKQ